MNFPIPHYPDKELLSNYERLKSNKSTHMSGRKIVNHFNPSIYLCNVKDHLSPFNAWYNKDIMRKALVNRQIYLNKTEISQNELMRGLSIGKFAPKVSVFSPGLAKYLVNKYLSEYDTIFDPCMGFSGRMLGVTSLNKKYIANDINVVLLEENKECSTFFNIDNLTELRKIDSTTDKGSFDCLFTCPPYGQKETWFDIESHDVFNSSVENFDNIYSAEEWISICLRNFKCKTYLFVVDNPGKYEKYVVETIEKKSYLTTIKEYVVLINET